MHGVGDLATAPLELCQSLQTSICVLVQIFSWYIRKCIGMVFGGHKGTFECIPKQAAMMPPSGSDSEHLLVLHHLGLVQLERVGGASDREQASSISGYFECQGTASALSLGCEGCDQVSLQKCRPMLERRSHDIPVHNASVRTRVRVAGWP